MIKTTRKHMQQSFTLAMHLKSIGFAKAAATIILAPWFAILINLLLMYVQYVYHILFIIAFSLAGWAILMVYLYVKTLKTYRTDDTLVVKHCLIIIGVPLALILFIIAVNLIIILTPHYL